MKASAGIIYSWSNKRILRHLIGSSLPSNVQGIPGLSIWPVVSCGSINMALQAENISWTDMSTHCPTCTTTSTSGCFWSGLISNETHAEFRQSCSALLWHRVWPPWYMDYFALCFAYKLACERKHIQLLSAPLGLRARCSKQTTIQMFILNRPDRLARHVIILTDEALTCPPLGRWNLRSSTNWRVFLTFSSSMENPNQISGYPWRNCTELLGEADSFPWGQAMFPNLVAVGWSEIGKWVGSEVCTAFFPPWSRTYVTCVIWVQFLFLVCFCWIFREIHWSRNAMFSLSEGPLTCERDLFTLNKYYAWETCTVKTWLCSTHATNPLDVIKFPVPLNNYSFPPLNLLWKK